VQHFRVAAIYDIGEHKRLRGAVFICSKGEAMTLKILGFFAVTLVVTGVLMNLPDIKRYIRISSM
jgi:hypothetical protein